MNKIILETAVFEFVEPHILQVLVADGIEVDLDTAKQYSDAIEGFTSSPTGLLVNKQNHYSLTFEAQQKVLSQLPNIVASALLVHSPISALCAETQLPTLEAHDCPAKVFNSRTKAIAWLHEQLRLSSKKTIRRA